jgi:hypothetical protein
MRKNIIEVDPENVIHDKGVRDTNPDRTCVEYQQFPKIPENSTWPSRLRQRSRERDVEWRDRKDSQGLCRYRYR